MRCGVCVASFIGLGLTIMSGALLGMYPPIYNHVFENMMKVTPGSYSYGLWHELPIPMFLKIYLFNVTNAQEIMDRKPWDEPIVPKLVEMGPYTFSEAHLKVNEHFEEGTGEKVKFQQVKTWHFMEELSQGSLDDMVTNVDMVALSAADFTRYHSPLLTGILNTFLKATNSKIFQTNSVRDLTFDGYLGPILEAIQNPIFQNLPIPYDRFGWFYPRNNSGEYDGYFQMYTGVDTLDHVGQICEWKNLSTVDPAVYPGQCGQLSGSAGEFFPPKRDKTFVDFFSPDLCRTIRFNYKEEAEVHGISGYRYYLDDELLSNETSLPENSCYNPNPDPTLYLPHGLLNVSTCKFNSPAYVSFPHFYLADEVLVKQFEPGTMVPDPEKHANYLSLMPDTGVPLEVRIRMQINGLVRSLENGQSQIDIYEGLEPLYYPLIWFENLTEVDEEIASLLRILPKLNAGFLWGPIVGLVIGIVILIASVAVQMGLTSRVRGRHGSRKSNSSCQILTVSSPVYPTLDSKPPLKS
ncbi:hypothetical protein TCAL_07973 [Tigriopus californicus]|uniref:Scavenger receptor class B member 1 n=1 Tax=Tigriopus californicus TaxID=6832 RepID=A0A553N8C9_TIGCA|nr:protein croquemort-like [Tigriopus californicus]TRY61675.1 hypothetical protein TCAL_07973 [Tigriopus californicus]